MAQPPVCLQTLEFDIAKLMRTRPPVWRHPHKQAVYELLKTKGLPSGLLRYTRWLAVVPDGELQLHPTEVSASADFYSYLPLASESWHVNFADPRLFAAYGSALLAQDELQVLEHPVLGSLREALLDAEHPALTRADGKSTPVVISGVPRQCAFDTEGATGKGRFWSRLVGGAPASQSLYGNHFQHASRDAVMNAVTVLKPATLSNIIAIAAPTGKGRYTRKHILDILETAYSGMKAAVMESQRRSTQATVEVHTGWWGCGAFGGNRELMSMLQVLAAKLAQVDRLVFHTGTKAEAPEFEEGCAFLESILADQPPSLSEVVDAIEALGFSWGVSDGN